MSKIKREQDVQVQMFQVESKDVLDQILKEFDCFTRPDRSDEFILEMAGIYEDHDQFERITEILDFNQGTNDCGQICGLGYAIFYA
jgi:hypothetical protein